MDIKDLLAPSDVFVGVRASNKTKLLEDLCRRAVSYSTACPSLSEVSNFDQTATAKERTLVRDNRLGVER
jgi:hypothetical protein